MLYSWVMSKYWHPLNIKNQTTNNAFETKLLLRMFHHRLLMIYVQAKQQKMFLITPWNVYLLYIYVGVIFVLLCLICIIKPWFALVPIIYLYIISWIRCHSLCVIFYFQEIMWEKWIYRNLWENGGQTIIKVELKDHT